MPSDIRRRAAVHAALGDPVRLGIIDDLGRSDRSPSELGARFSLPGNLLAHHLGVLDRVGLIERIVSTADRRRRYVRLVRDQIVDTPVLAPAATRSILFVCTQNSARSQLAAALWTRHTGTPATSAGTEPSDRVHPGAVRAAARAGLDLSRAVPRSLGDAGSADQVVTVCDRAHEGLTPPDDWWHWSIPDPVIVGTVSAFDTAVAQIEHRVRALSPERTVAP